MDNYILLYFSRSLSRTAAFLLPELSFLVPRFVGLGVLVGRYSLVPFVVTTTRIVDVIFVSIFVVCIDFLIYL